MDEYKVQIGAELDSKSFETIHNNINTKINNIKELTKISITIDDKQFNTQIANIKKEIGKLGNIKIKISGIGNSANNIQDVSLINKQIDAYKKLSQQRKEINATALKITSLKNSSNSSNEITSLEIRLKALKDTHQALIQSLKTPLNDGQWDNLYTSIAQTQKKIEELKASTSDSIIKNLDVNSFVNSVSSLESKFNGLKVKSTELTSNLNNVKSALKDMSSAKDTGDIDGLINAHNRFQQSLQRTKNLIDIESRAEADVARTERENAKALKEVINAQQTLTKSNTLSNQIQVWMNQNKKAAEQYKNELIDLQKQLNNNTDSSKLKDISLKFQEIKSSANASGLTVSSFGTSLKNTILQAAGFGSAIMAFQRFTQVIKEGFDTVVELDNALIDLKKTTTMSGNELASFYYDANESAKKYGATTAEIIQSAADWSRLGYNTREEAQTMAELSSIMATISPGADIENATTGLISVMKAYGIEAKDVLDGVISKINEVGNTAGTSNIQIINGLERASSALALTNTSLDSTIALFTAGQEIIQNDALVGNALRSISMRIRGYSEDTEELSDELVNIKGELIDLTKTASNGFQGISLFTDIDQTHYKDVYQYLKEISMIWDELSEKQQQNLLEKLFGKNRANVGSAILSNMQAADKALETMSNSAGSAEREMETASQSIAYHMNELGETWVGVAQNLLQSDFLKGFIDTLTFFSNIVQELTKNSLVAIPAITGIVSAIASFKGVGELIKQFHYSIILDDEYAHEVFTNGNMNDIMFKLVA